MKTEHEQIKRLIQQLDSYDGNIGQDAGWILYTLGEIVIEPILGALPHLGIYGWIEGLDCLSHFTSSQLRQVPTQLFAQALIPLLEQDGFVLSEAATLLASAQVMEAVDALESARIRLINEGLRPDDTDRSSIRHALTELGSRQEIYPPKAKQLAIKHLYGPIWTWHDLPQVLESLEQASQAILSISTWTLENGNLLRSGHGWSNPSSFGHDWTWEVQHAFTQALNAIQTTQPPPHTYAMLDWLRASDLER